MPDPVAHADLGAVGALDPEVANILRLAAKARRPEYWQLTPAEARVAYERAMRVLDIAPARVHRVEPIDVPGGSPAQLYWPREPSWTEPLPALVWFHGGGFTVGSVKTADALARRWCNGAACAVLSVDYRLAPEHKFPTAVDDAWAALRWIADEAASLGIDANRLAVGGDSAGGTLAAACAIRARDESLPLRQQLLVYPGMASRQDSDSHRRFAQDHLITAPTIAWFFDQYLRSPADRDDWRFAPLQAHDLTGLAPACVAVAEFDPLVDEGVAYARRLEQAGVPTTLKLYPGMIHAFFEMGGFLAAARTAHADTVAQLHAAFGTGAPA
ncbi:alpha/beta hydrolase [soil metagenome]